MDTNLFFLALFEASISIVAGVSILYINYRIFYNVIGEKLHVEKNNVSFALLVSAVILSVGMLLTEVIDPIVSTTKVISEQKTEFGNLVFQVLKFTSIYLLIGMITSALVNYVSISFFTFLTMVDELQEIRKNNIAVALITGTVVISITLLMKSSVGLMIDAFYPYPSFEGTFIGF